MSGTAEPVQLMPVVDGIRSATPLCTALQLARHKRAALRRLSVASECR